MLEKMAFRFEGGEEEIFRKSFQVKGKISKSVVYLVCLEMHNGRKGQAR